LNLNFQSHGVQENPGYNLLLPITTLLEESAYFIDNHGDRKKSITVSIRKSNMRNILQILKVIKSILLDKPEKSFEFNVIKDIILLKYGIIDKRVNLEFIKLPKIKLKKEHYIADVFENLLLKKVELLKIKKAFNIKKNY